MTKKKAIITGVTGQDGSYLAELLLSKGYEVHGIKRRASSFNTGRIDHIEQRDLSAEGKDFIVHYGDMTDVGSLTRLIRDIQPDEIYNIAAQSHVQVSFEIPEYTADSVGIGVLKILEAIRLFDMGGKIKFYQASSSEMFGATPPPQNEHSPFYPRSPYGIAKLYAYWITRNYREAYGMFASNGILFNHESPRRGETFVTRKITRAAARIKCGLQEVLYLGNLDAERDWGHAKDYVEAMYLILQRETPGDYVVATGDQHSVREFCEAAFKEVGFDISWSGAGVEEVGTDIASGKIIVRLDKKYFRPTEVDSLRGDASKIRKELGWKPKVGFAELVKEMVEHDLTEAMREVHLKSGGFRTSNNHYEK